MCAVSFVVWQMVTGRWVWQRRICPRVPVDRVWGQFLTTEKPLSRTNTPLTSPPPLLLLLPTLFFLFLSIFPKPVSGALPKIGGGERCPVVPVASLCPRCTQPAQRDGRGDSAFSLLPALSAPGPGLWCLGEAGRGPSELPGALFGPEKS